MAIVLVVDDEVSITEILIELVEDAGHTAVVSHNGFDGLALARQYQPALIISDIMMPIMNGYEFITALRADPLLAHTMVVLISAHIHSLRFQTTAPTTFVPKPLDLEVIDSFLQRLT